MCSAVTFHGGRRYNPGVDTIQDDQKREGDAKVAGEHQLIPPRGVPQAYRPSGCSRCTDERSKTCNISVYCFRDGYGGWCVPWGWGRGWCGGWA